MNGKDSSAIRNCLFGMAMAESSDDVGEVVKSVLCTCYALADSDSKPEVFVKSLSKYLSGLEQKSDQLIAVRSLPIGLYNDTLPSVIEWARESAMLSTNDPVITVSSAAVALMGFLARNEVPVGLWGHELSLPLSGLALAPGLPKEIQVDDVFLGSLERATSSAGSASIFPATEAVHEVVSAALFGCMSSPDDVELAVSIARDSCGIYAACISGGLIAIRAGIPFVSVNPLLHNLLSDAAKAFSDR